MLLGSPPDMVHGAMLSGPAPIIENTLYKYTLYYTPFHHKNQVLFEKTFVICFSSQLILKKSLGFKLQPLTSKSAGALFPKYILKFRAEYAIIKYNVFIYKYNIKEIML